MTKPIIAEELIYRIGNLVRQNRLVVELERERNSLKELAFIDSTTGLYNRTAFNQPVPQQLEQAALNELPVSLAVMDIDMFKRINDVYGHDTGDRVLQDVGLWLRSTLRKGDMVFRWGGDELLILLRDCKAEFAQ